MERLILARHGESEFSVRGHVNGDESIACALTARGVEEARTLGEQLRAEALDLCATSRFERVRQTADLALAGRDVPRLVVAELGDPNYGGFEGGSLEVYRAWASSSRSSAAPSGGGESRVAIVRRYVHGFRLLLARAERTILLVGHSLPLAYLLAASDGAVPAPRVPLVEYAKPYPLEAPAVERALELLEGWCASPTW